MIGHRSERFCVFLPIFAGRDGEGNEQKFGEEGDQAKQWSLCFEKSITTQQDPLDREICFAQIEGNM